MVSEHGRLCAMLSLPNDVANGNLTAEDRHMEFRNRFKCYIYFTSVIDRLMDVKGAKTNIRLYLNAQKFPDTSDRYGKTKKKKQKKKNMGLQSWPQKIFTFQPPVQFPDQFQSG